MEGQCRHALVYIDLVNKLNTISSGFFPARVLVCPIISIVVFPYSCDTYDQRTFLKDPSTKRNIPIHAIGLSLYEALPGTTAEQIGNEVIKTQWLCVNFDGSL